MEPFHGAQLRGQGFLRELVLRLSVIPLGLNVLQSRDQLALWQRYGSVGTGCHLKECASLSLFYRFTSSLLEDMASIGGVLEAGEKG